MVSIYLKPRSLASIVLLFLIIPIWNIYKLQGGNLMKMIPSEMEEQEGKGADMGDTALARSPHQAEGTLLRQQQPKNLNRIKTIIEEKRLRRNENYHHQNNTKRERPKRGPRVQQQHRRKDVDALRPNIRLIGERHSGTNFVSDFLSGCFPRRMGNYLLNYKHWMQPTPEYIRNITNEGHNHVVLEDFGTSKHAHEQLFSWVDIGKMSKEEAEQTALNDTFVIMMVRDPYDWMESMRKGPYHWIHHMGTFVQKEELSSFQKHRKLLGLPEARKWNQRRRRRPGGGVGFRGGPRWTNIPLGWKQFVETPLKFSSELNKTNGKTPAICQKGYLENLIDPCPSQAGNYIPDGFDEFTVPNRGVLPWAARDPFYELQPTSSSAASPQPFLHPLAFRSYKLQNMLLVPKNWKTRGFRVVRYEDLSKKLLTGIVQQLSKELGLTPYCDPQAVDVKLSTRKDISREYSTWITENGDWDTEALVGYKPRR